ncbi:MAG: YtxH domain-containing protein [Candidatus Saccharimonadales bacterium]
MAKYSFAIGALVGGLAGVIAGLLTAPRTGEQTRSDIRLKARELKAKSQNQPQITANKMKSGAPIWAKSSKNPKK